MQKNPARRFVHGIARPGLTLAMHEAQQQRRYKEQNALPIELQSP